MHFFLKINILNILVVIVIFVEIIVFFFLVVKRVSPLPISGPTTKKKLFL